MDLSTGRPLSNEPQNQPGAAAQEKPVLQAKQIQAARALRAFALIGLAGTIILAPFRLHAVLVTRPISVVWGDYTNILLYAADVFLAAALIFWLLSLAVDHRRINLGPLWLTLPLAGLTLVSLASSPTSTDPLLSLYHSARLALLFGFYLLIVNEIRFPDAALVFLAAGVQVAVQAAVAVAQSLEQHSLGLSFLQEMPVDPAWKGASIVLTAAGRSLRAYGLSDHPNILGGCLAFGLLLGLAWHLGTPDRWKVTTGGVFILGSAALLLTFSRSAWLGFGAGLTLIGAWLLLAGRKSDLLQLGALLLATLLVLSPFLWHNAGLLDTRLGANGSFNAATPENQSIQERGILIREAAQLFLKNPLTGVGVGSFPERLQQAWPGSALALQPPHLVLLDVAAETGAAGGLFYLFLEVFPWVYLLTRPKKVTISLPMLGVLAALLAASVVSLFDYYPWLLNAGRIWQWLLWGLLGAALVSIERERAHV